MKRKDIIELLKTGNFTIAYHDNCVPSLYKGKWKYKHLDNKEEVDFENFDNGYCPEIVALLVEALGGNSDSI